MYTQDSVVAITGGYRGLGAALSTELARRHCKLVIGGRNEKELADFCENLGTDAHYVKMDVRKKEDCKNFIDETIKKFGRIDVLINNAGIWWIDHIQNVTEEKVDEMFETNTYGPLWCMKAAAEQMKNQQSGVIVNVCSTAGLDFRSTNLLYAGSKSALIGITGSVVKELEREGIRVICFCPGGMKTELFRRNPERMQENFMEPSFVAKKIIESMDSDSGEWLFVLRGN